MKFKMILLAIALTVFVGGAFAGGASVYNEDTILTTECNGGVPIPDGEATVYIYWTATDAQYPEGPGFLEADNSDFLINGCDGYGQCGFFYSPWTFIPKNAEPAPNTFYIVVEYPTVNPTIRWVSDVWELPAGLPVDIFTTGWECQTLTIPCTPQNYDIPVQNWHTFAPYYQCLHLCPGIVSTVCLHGLKADNVPHVTLIPGCTIEPFCFDPNCPPVVPSAGAWRYIPNPTGGQFGSWCIDLVSPLEGCVCFCVDLIESAELGNFDAVAGDNSVELNWSTLSESNLSSFRVIRDNEVIGSVSAQNSVSGASYTFVDNNAVNGTSYTYSLASVNMDGTVEDWGVTVTAAPSMNAAVITEYALLQNYPNPFNPTTNIVFDVVNENFVTLTVYNAMGQEVATLVNGTQASGRHTVAFDAANLTSGLYFYTVKIGNEFTATKKMMLVK